MQPFLEMDLLLKHLRTLKDAARDVEVCAALDDLTAILQRMIPIPPLPKTHCFLKSRILKGVTTEDFKALLSDLEAAEPTNRKLLDAVKRVREELIRT
jgi:hypothetical protein